MPIHCFLNLFKRNQIAYHNLCTHLTPPPHTDQLLWLGLKFCIQRPLPKPAFDEYFERLIRDVRLTHIHGPKHCANKITLSNGKTIDISEHSFNPKLYIKTANYEPKEAPPPPRWRRPCLSSEKAFKNCSNKTNQLGNTTYQNLFASYYKN